MKRYNYIGIGKLFRVCRNFSVRGRPAGGGAGPPDHSSFRDNMGCPKFTSGPDVNLGHPILSRKLLELES